MKARCALVILVVAQGGALSAQGDDFGPLPLISDVSTRTPQPIERVPSTVTIISGDDIRRSGARFWTDALRMLPGLEVQRISSTEVNVNVRGYNDASTASQGMLALVDGRQVYNGFLGNPLWDQIPVDVDSLERVEVVRGPGSFVHGPNAMHGVVNVVTRSPLDYGTDYLSIGAAGGSYDSTVARLVGVRRAGDLGIKTTLVWDDIDEFESAGEDTKNKRFIEVRLESLIDEDPEHRVDVITGYGRQKFDLLIPSLFGIPPSTFANDAAEGFVRAEYENHGLRGVASWTAFDSESEPDGFYPPFDLDLDTVDLDLQYTAEPWSGHDLTVGAGARFSTFATRNQDVANGRHDTRLGWLFVQDEFELSDSWFLTAGLRYDHHSEAGANFAPRAALVWEFDQHEVDDERVRTQSLRVSYGQGFRFPSLRELWLDMPVMVGGAAYEVAGNLELDAEQLQSLEAAYTGTFDDTRLTLASYYNFIDGLVDYEPTSLTRVVPTNQADEEAYGFEVDAQQGVTDWLSAFGNYSYGFREARQERNALAPRHKFNVGLRADVLSDPEDDPGLGLHATLWVHYFDEIELFDMTVDGYVLLNGHVSYDFRIGSREDGNTRGRVFVQGFNLLDEQHREHPEGDEYGLMLLSGLAISF